MLFSIQCWNVYKLLYYFLKVCEMDLSSLDMAKVFKKILLHPGQFVLPQHIYRDCRGLDADGTLVRMN